MGTPLVQIGLDVNVVDASRVVAGVSDRVKDWSPVLRGSVSRDIHLFFKRQFDTEGQEGGTPWAPLKPLTLKLRKRRGHGRGGIGRDTNELWASLVKAGPKSVRVVESKRLSQGTTVAHAPFFHFGVKAGRHRVFGRPGGGVPARALVPDPFPQPYVDRFERALVRYFTDGKAA